MAAERRLRQQPGYACEECRRRKARCDRVRPKCGFCIESGTQCIVVNKRQQRGPGQFSSMQSQIATLRWQLGQHLGHLPVISTEGPTYDPDSAAGASVRTLMDDFDVQGSRLSDQDALLDSATSAQTSATSMSVTSVTPVTTESSSALPGWPDWPDWQDISASSSLMPPQLMEITLDHLDVDAGPRSPPSTTDANKSAVKMTDLMRAELDQLYFDRVHAFCPIIHRRRYFASIVQDSHTPAQECLRSALRTLAAAMSAHWCHLSEQLCTETRTLLEAYAQTRTMSRDKIPLEHIQAWLLLSHYELLRMSIHQAMLTAGRAFRLVQMARLSEIDVPNSDPQYSSSSSCSSSSSTTSESGERFVDAEERRRTFWLAFSFDRFLCLRNEWPLTLQEDMISTRLPAPEANFQDNQPTRVSFLPEAMAQIGSSTLSPFAECVVMATLHGRCMAHRRSHARVSDHGTGDFWTRQEWLATAVERRVQMLVPSSAVDSDPMLLFTHMLAYCATLHLSNTVQRASCHTIDQQLLAAAYQRRALEAASEIVHLAKAVPYLSCFKAHPFLPDPLACAATFLNSQSSTQGTDWASVQHLLRVLSELQDTHSLARDHLQALHIQD